MNDPMRVIRDAMLLIDHERSVVEAAYKRIADRANIILEAVTQAAARIDPDPNKRFGSCQ